MSNDNLPTCAESALADAAAIAGIERQGRLRAEAERDELRDVQRSDYALLLDFWRERGLAVPGADKQSVIQRVLLGLLELSEQRDAARAALAESEQRVCETCLYQRVWVPSMEMDPTCGRTNEVRCVTLGNGCRAWAPREGA